MYRSKVKAIRSKITFEVQQPDPSDQTLGLTARYKTKRGGAVAHVWEALAAGAEAALPPDSVLRDDAKNSLFALFSDYKELVKALQPIAAEHGLEIKRIPLPLELWFANAERRRSSAAAIQVDWTKISPKIVAALFPYQKDGVTRAIQQKGRLFLCDEMGLGKSLQSIAVADYYATPESKQLIIVPSYLRHNWKREFATWTAVDPDKIQIVMKTKQPVDPEASHVIISYDLAVRKVAEIAAIQWRTIVVDECHYVKSRKAKRTKALTPILHKAEHLLMLSGTPALSRPEELFTQLHALFPRTFKTFSPFAFRYCDFKQSKSFRSTPSSPTPLSTFACIDERSAAAHSVLRVGFVGILERRRTQPSHALRHGSTFEVQRAQGSAAEDARGVARGTTQEGAA